MVGGPPCCAGVLLNWRRLINGRKPLAAAEFTHAMAVISMLVFGRLSTASLTKKLRVCLLLAADKTSCDGANAAELRFLPGQSAAESTVSMDIGRCSYLACLLAVSIATGAEGGLIRN